MQNVTNAWKKPAKQDVKPTNQMDEQGNQTVTQPIRITINGTEVACFQYRWNFIPIRGGDKSLLMTYSMQMAQKGQYDNLASVIR